MWGGVFLCMCAGGGGALGVFAGEGERIKFYGHILYINEFAVEH